MAGKKTQKRIQNPSLTGEIPYGQFQFYKVKIERNQEGQFHRLQVTANYRLHRECLRPILTVGTAKSFELVDIFQKLATKGSSGR